MNLDKLKKVWEFINGLSPRVKTMVIIILLIITIKPFVEQVAPNCTRDYIEYTESETRRSEKYTLSIAPLINQYVEDIQQQDMDCSNVLLLSYHNSKKSLQGISYIYLNCIAEEPRCVEDGFVRDYWKDLDYIYYQEELSKIHQKEEFIVSNTDSIKSTYPKLYRSLHASQAGAAILYPIVGVDSYIGMVIILYKNPIDYDKLLSKEKPSIYIQKLATLLDYPNLKNKNL